MPKLVAQTLLSMLMMALATLLYTVIAAGTYELLGWRYDVLAFALAGLLTWAFVAVFWILLWRGRIRWTKRRRRKTVTSFMIVLLPAAGMAVLTSPVDPSFGICIGGSTAILLWLTRTIFIWRETPAERSDRIRNLGDEALVCPNCGYNMTGLTTSTCPECGSSYTLDELVRSQPSQEENQIERD